MMAFYTLGQYLFYNQTLCSKSSLFNPRVIFNKMLFCHFCVFAKSRAQNLMIIYFISFGILCVSFCGIKYVLSHSCLLFKVFFREFSWVC